MVIGWAVLCVPHRGFVPAVQLSHWQQERHLVAEHNGMCGKNPGFSIDMSAR